MGFLQLIGPVESPSSLVIVALCLDLHFWRFEAFGLKFMQGPMGLAVWCVSMRAWTPVGGLRRAVEDWEVVFLSLSHYLKLQWRWIPTLPENSPTIDKAANWVNSLFGVFFFWPSFSLSSFRNNWCPLWACWQCAVIQTLIFGLITFLFSNSFFLEIHSVMHTAQ